MSLIASAIRTVERTPLPDSLTKLGVGLLVGRTARALSRSRADEEREFARQMRAHPIALHQDAANRQHYELPPEFFALILGPRRKYSCALYQGDRQSLAEAELHALAETAAHADLADGQEILELGCGWGSLTLFMAERYRRSRIVAVSNSRSQRAYIEAQAAARGLKNVTVMTADMNDFEIDMTFDRVVSVEMFEHISNWPSLLARVRAWLRPEGRLFIHVFAHAARPYRFVTEDKEDWIAQNFFTGGIMPSHGLIKHCCETFTAEAEWRWSGTHYQRTARDWLAQFDCNAAAIRTILAAVYGAEATIWQRRWRLFFLATAGLFGHNGGRDWGISHYRLRPTPAA